MKPGRLFMPHFKASAVTWFRSTCFKLRNILFIVQNDHNVIFENVHLF